MADMDLRALVYGILGWVLPGAAAAIPFVAAHETVGGQSMIGAGALWLLGLGPVGCAIAAWRSARIGAGSTTFWYGLAGILLAVPAILAVDAMVSVVTIGPVAFLLVLPLFLGYGVGFAIGVFNSRRADHTESPTTDRRRVDRRVLAGVGLWGACVLAALVIAQFRGTFSYINLSVCLVVGGFVAGTYLIRPSIGALILLVLGLVLAWPLPSGWLRSVRPDLFATAGDLQTVGAVTLFFGAMVTAIWRRPLTRTPSGAPVVASELVYRIVLLCVVGGPLIQVVAFAAWNYYSSPFFLGLAIALFGLLLFIAYSAFYEVIRRPNPAAIVAFTYPAMLLALALVGPTWVVTSRPVAEGVEDMLVDGRVIRASVASPLGPPAYAMDDRTDTAWNAGQFAPAWIEIDLTEPTLISELRLLVAQSPAGETFHEVIGIPSTGSAIRLAEFRGSTRDGEWLVQSLATPMADIATIRITTVASPSWVAWREIELIADVR
jgi:MFS family permease